MAFMRKERDIDFLPWILGGFLVAAGAIAAVVAIQSPTTITPARRYYRTRPCRRPYSIPSGRCSAITVAPQ